MHALPQGATPIDFAYAIHTEVGHRTVGARVNGRLVPLESELSNGDVVEILTTKAEGAGPNRDWLEFVKSPRARNKIRHYFTKGRREESIETGKEAIARQMRKAGLPLQRLLTLEHLTAVADYFKLPDVSALYAAVGEGTVGPQAVINRLISVEGGEDATADEINEDQVVTGRRRRKSSASDSGIEVAGDTDLLVKLAKCCTPVPGDPILGFVTRGAGVSVHRDDCVNAAHLQTEHAERIIGVSWAPTAQSSFLVAIQVEALDRNRLLSDITRSLSDQHVNILSAGAEHLQGPDLQGPVHLRDRRPDPPGPRAARRPAGGGRVRRLPHPAVTLRLLTRDTAKLPRRNELFFTRSCRRSSRNDVKRCRSLIVPPSIAPESSWIAATMTSTRRSAAEVVGRLARLGQPLAVGRRRRRRVPGGLGVAPGLGLGGLLLQGRDLGLELAGGLLGAGPGLRVGPPPLVVLVALDGGLDGPQPAVQWPDHLPRHLADVGPALQHRAVRGAGRGQVADGEDGLGLLDQCLLGDAVGS